ncbi:hypothetical protein GGI23_003527 [Coemansia sp. RSA 2559]|nr:hypothetical protein GGI23_003527 [Coemansia sp. RSA 2559]KAJ2860483.1 hypothetical protein GGI22_002702 [Coemansia erecta]
MPEKLRKELCAEQVLYCTNVCGGEGLTREAFCNTNTLGSKCECTNGAEAAIHRYQWPVFQRVCEAQRSECRAGCNGNGNMSSAERTSCFTSCDARVACTSDQAPDYKVMVQKYDDQTTGSKPQPKLPSNETTTGPNVIIADGGSSKIKPKKDDKDGAPKRRGGPLPKDSKSAASIASVNPWFAAAIPAIAVAAFGYM